MAGKVTLRDIAREVGLSTTAVSLVLNNRPCRISEESRRRIGEAARRKGYVPNQIARSLVTQRSQTIGLIVPNIESRFFSSLARRLEAGCRSRGYVLLITNSDDSSTNDAELVRLLANRGVDGLFLVVSDESGDNGGPVDALSSLPVPYVLVDRTIEGLRCDRVSFNNERGGYLACRHLLDAGHRRIACVVNASSATGRERLVGYERALREAGVTPDPALEITSTYYIPSAYRAAGRLLDTDATAVFAGSDNIALGLLKRFHERGLRVPRDLSVVSYDNSAADVLFEPALTSVEQNVDELAQEALEMLFARIEGRLADGRGDAAAHPAPEARVLAPRLVFGQSVRTLGGESDSAAERA